MPGPEALFSKQVLNEGWSLALRPGPAKPSLASGSLDLDQTGIEPTEDACTSPSYTTGSEKAKLCPRSHRRLEEQPRLQRAF